jgi:AcrR family transcriptional regulator
MNRIAAEAGVAPMTIYRQFDSKDRLVAAVIEAWSTRSLSWLADRLDPHGEDPETWLRTLWDVLEEWLAAEDFQGALVTSVATELRGSGDHPAHRAVEAHRVVMRRLLEDMAATVGAADPPRLAAMIQFLVEGVAASAGVERWPAEAEGVRALADAAFGGQQTR